MRILHAIAPGPIAGAEKSALASAKALADLGHKAVFAVLGDRRKPECGRDFAELAERNGIESELFFAEGRIDFKIYGKLRRFATTGGFHIVHSHSYKTLAYLSSYRGALPALVSTYHGATSHTAQVRLYEWVEWSLFQGLDCLFVVSNGALETLQAKGPLKCPVAIVPNAISDSAISRKNRVNKGVVRPIKLLCLGRLSPEKGIDVLLTALAKMENIEIVRLTVVGDGSERAKLEDLVFSLGLAGHVVFTGFTSDIKPELDSADVLVMPSSTEGLPMTLIEAAYAGLPVVASDVGGIPDIVRDGKNGLLVKPNQPLELASAISRMVDNLPSFIDGARAASSEIAEKYSSSAWTRIAMIEYERVLRRRRLKRAARG